MKIEIFYLEGDELPAQHIAGLLREFLYPNLSPVMRGISRGSYQPDLHEIGRRYIRLLQASIPPETGIRLSSNVFGFFGYRMYVEVYRPFGYPIAFQSQDMDSFFPAVAVRERMVLVPAELGRAWHRRSGSTIPFYPLQMGGALEVEFQDDEDLRASVREVSRGIKADLLQEVRAYTSFRAQEDIDLVRMAEDQNVDLGFLRQVLETAGEQLAFYGQLNAELEPKSLPLGRWTKVELTLENKSSSDLTRLELHLEGPVAVRPTEIRVDLPPGATQAIPLSLKPEDTGEFPLEVRLTLPEDRALARWLPVHHFWLLSE